MKQARCLTLLCATGVALVACGDTFINPPHNLRRPSDIVIVTSLPVSETSTEYALVLDTEHAQVLIIDVVNRLLADLHLDVPGYNGVFIGGQPTAMAVRADQSEVVVANFGLGLLQIICTPVAPIAQCPKPALVASIDVGEDPERVAVVGNIAYVSRPRAGIVVKVDLATRQVVGSFEVGGQPRGLQPTNDGARLFVADSLLPTVTRIDLASGGLKTINVGGPSESIFVSPSPEWVYAVRADRGSVVVIDPATESVHNPFPDGPPGAGPDVELPGRITAMAFQTFTAAENFSVGVGQMAFVAAADGIVYLLNTDGPTPHRELNASPPAIGDGGVVDCQTARWSSDAGLQNACPRLQVTPQLTVGASGLAITADLPSIENYTLPPEFGVHLARGRRVVRTEQWNFTYEGSLPGVASTKASILAGNVLRNADVRFFDIVVPTTGEKAIRDGDLVIITDPPANSGAAIDGGVGGPCANVEFETPDRRRRWLVTLSGLAPNDLVLTPRDGAALPPLETCYTQVKVEYEVRVRDAWLAQGDQSGLQGRARECPNPADGGMVVDCSAFVYTNPFFALTIRQGTQPSLADLRWSFQTNDGVTPASVSLNVSQSLAGTPRALAASKRSRTVLVVDESDESIAFIDGRIPQLDLLLR